MRYDRVSAHSSSEEGSKPSFALAKARKRDSIDEDSRYFNNA